MKDASTSTPSSFSYYANADSVRVIGTVTISVSHVDAIALDRLLVVSNVLFAIHRTCVIAVLLLKGQ